MVAVVTGSGLGLDRSSGFVLGSRGQLGGSVFGRFGENVTVNAATGNVFIQRTDEILLGLGPDAVVTRSYNSLGTGTDDNSDNWQLGAQRRIVAVANGSGDFNATGSTVTRYDWDGSSLVYTWDPDKSAYVSNTVSHQDDRFTLANGVWTRQWPRTGQAKSAPSIHLSWANSTPVRLRGTSTSHSFRRWP